MSEPLRRVSVVAAVVWRGDDVFAARRRPSVARGGAWEFPGGKVEPGESEPEALCRELEEELGLSVHIGERLGAWVHRYPDLEVELIAYACAWREGPSRQTDHDRIVWTRPSALPELAWAEADLGVVDLILAGGGRFAR